MTATVVVGGYNASSAGVFGIGKLTSVCCSFGTSLFSIWEEVAEMMKTHLTVG